MVSEVDGMRGETMVFRTMYWVLFIMIWSIFLKLYDGLNTITFILTYLLFLAWIIDLFEFAGAIKWKTKEESFKKR